MSRIKLVIVGDTGFAEIAKVYFDADRVYEVVAFSVEGEFLKRKELLGLPVVPFESIERTYSPTNHHIFVAVTYTQLNRLRTRLMQKAKELGYSLASYISPHAYIGYGVQIGQNCFVFENNTIQPFVSIQDNVIIWSGNHIGHHSLIQSNCFISSHAVVAGYCTIGANSFLGINTSISNNLNIGRDNWIGPGAVINKNTDAGQVFSAPSAILSSASSWRLFKVK